MAKWRVIIPNQIEMLHDRYRPYRVELMKDTCFFVNGNGYIIKKGFWWDGASFPRAVMPLLGGPLRGPYVISTLFHDVCYAAKLYEKRIDADEILLAMLALEGCSWWKRHEIYAGVRMGGWLAWNSKTDKEIEGALQHVKMVGKPDVKPQGTKED